MSTITLQNFRVGSDLTVKVRLKDGGVAIDWSTLSGIRAVLYSDAQSSIAGRCDVTVDGEDPTLLVCRYAATKMQYLGVHRIVVSAKYMGMTKTYDKPAFTFVRWTEGQAGEEITIEDPEVTVEIDVEDVSSSILQEAVDAAFSAADRANEAAEAAEHMVDIHTGPEGKSAYEVAVEEGYTGTEEEWLASLKGPQGKSAYEVAVEEGYTGTEEEWLASLKGPQGNSGYTGAAGELEVVNNLEDGGPTAALSAEAGKLLSRNMKLLYDSMGAAAFWDVKPDIDWSGNSVPVSLSLSNCSSSNIASYADLGDTYYTEITPDSGCILASVSCMMNGEVVPVVNGVINIAQVTGSILITAVGANLDTVAYDGKTYRQIFETNNKLVGKGLSPGFDNGSYSPATVSSGSPAITSNEYDTPGYSLDCTSAGKSSQLKIASITNIASVNLFMAARVKITSWTHGLVGILHYSNASATLARVTNGWETVSAILNEQGTNCFFGAFNQDGTAATLTGFLDSPVMILMSSFSTAPTIDKLNALYEEYINIKKAS